jgi:rhomboid protease GluP
MVLSAALQVILAAAVVGPAVRARRRWTAPWLTLAVLIILLICAVAQVRYPWLLESAERSAMVQHGQSWRLISAPWFQDGGLSGTLLNLAMLVAIGWVGETELTRPCWIGAYVCGALVGGMAGLAWQPVGAGNSIAVLGVAGAAFAERALRASSPRERLTGASPLILCLFMTAMRDIHGVAALAGALFAPLFGISRRQDV